MTGMQKRVFDQPDETRRFEHGHIDLVTLPRATIGRAVFEPGWRWSQDVKPIAGTDSCQAPHLGEAAVCSHRQHGTDVMPPGVIQIAHAADGFSFFNQLLHVCTHPHAEVGILACLAGQEFEKNRLRKKHDVGKSRLEAAKVKWSERAVGCHNGWPVNFGVRELVQALGQSNFIQNFHHRRMNGISAKLAVEILVCFQQRDLDSLPRQQQRQHHSAWSTAYNAASGLVDVAGCAALIPLRNRTRGSRHDSKDILFETGNWFGRQKNGSD